MTQAADYQFINTLLILHEELQTVPPPPVHEAAGAALFTGDPGTPARHLPSNTPAFDVLSRWTGSIPKVNELHGAGCWIWSTSETGTTRRGRNPLSDVSLAPVLG